MQEYTVSVAVCGNVEIKVKASSFKDAYQKARGEWRGKIGDLKATSAQLRCAECENGRADINPPSDLDYTELPF